MSDWFKRDLDAVKSLKNGESTNIFWSEDGGGVVHLIEYHWYFLFSVPIYGGEPVYEGVYKQSKLEELVSEAHSWT